MASKFTIPRFVLAIILHYLSVLSTAHPATPAPVPASDVGKLPIIIISHEGTLSTPVRITFFVGQQQIASISVAQNQKYTLKPTAKRIHEGEATYTNGIETPFRPYAPKRDAGHEIVYWKANDDGLYISYDAAKWKFVTPWWNE